MLGASQLVPSDSEVLDNIKASGIKSPPGSICNPKVLNRQCSFSRTRSSGRNVILSNIIDAYPGPGTYKFKCFLDELLGKKCGTRGPYDLLTGPRSKDCMTSGPGPGSYEYKSFLDEWSRPEKAFVGKFRRQSENLPRKSKVVMPVRSEVSRFSYHPQPQCPKFSNSNFKHAPFLTSARRFARDLGRSYPGPGRYAFERYDNFRSSKGPTWMFNSTTPAVADFKENLKWAERLRAVNIPPQKYTCRIGLAG